jgi:hypothetical protein
VVAASSLVDAVVVDEAGVVVGVSSTTSPSSPGASSTKAEFSLEKSLKMARSESSCPRAPSGFSHPSPRTEDGKMWIVSSSIEAHPYALHNRTQATTPSNTSAAFRAAFFLRAENLID